MLQTSIEKLRTDICKNTEARIYAEGVQAGKKEGIDRIVSLAVAAVNGIARVVATGILLGVLIAAGNTVGAIDLVVKMFGR